MRPSTAISILTDWRVQVTPEISRGTPYINRKIYATSCTAFPTFRWLKNLPPAYSWILHFLLFHDCRVSMADSKTHLTAHPSPAKTFTPKKCSYPRTIYFLSFFPASRMISDWRPITEMGNIMRMGKEWQVGTCKLPESTHASHIVLQPPIPSWSVAIVLWVTVCGLIVAWN